MCALLERYELPTFAEPLPQNCPPAEATEDSFESVYRLVANNPPLEGDFHSKALLGEACPDGICECVWASCSLFAKARTLRKYTRLRKEFPYLAELTLPDGVGKAIQGNSKRGHVDFWRYSETSLQNYVVNVEGPENDQ